MAKLTTTVAASTALILFTACSAKTEAPAPTTPAAPQAQASDVSQQSAAMGVKVKAVLLYADWCGSCKVLDPKVNAVRSGNDLKAIDFVVLDYTDKNEADFYAQASAAGVAAPLKALLGDSVKTGFLVLVDADDNTVIGQVNKTMSEAEILVLFQTAVKGA